MIKFFRKIRHNLLLENKTRKYFKYAIGEIFLIMIGILLALQVNDWNESRKNRKTEIQFLKGIKQDLQTDSLELNKLDHDYKRKLANYKLIDPSFETLPNTPKLENNSTFNFQLLLFHL